MTQALSSLTHSIIKVLPTHAYSQRSFAPHSSSAQSGWQISGAAARSLDKSQPQGSVWFWMSQAVGAYAFGACQSGALSCSGFHLETANTAGGQISVFPGKSGEKLASSFCPFIPTLLPTLNPDPAAGGFPHLAREKPKGEERKKCWKSVV